MTSTVSTTVRNALPAEAVSRFPDQVAAVEQALTERDHGLVEAITQQVVQHFNVPANQVQDQLAYIGMAVRPAAPAPVLPHFSPVVDEDEDEAAESELPSFMDEPAAAEVAQAKAKKGKKSRLARLEKAVGKLTKIAERHGL